MTDEEAISLVTRLVCRGRHMDESQVSETTNLTDELGFDSLDAAELLAALHEETGMQLDVDSMTEIKTVRDIADHLVRYPAQSRAGQRAGQPR